MKTKRTLETIIEVERVRIFCRRAALTITYCAECRTETHFAAAADAARMLETDAPTIIRLTEAGALHSLFADGETSVCLASLIDFEASRFR